MRHFNHDASIGSSIIWKVISKVEQNRGTIKYLGRVGGEKLFTRKAVHRATQELQVTVEGTILEEGDIALLESQGRGTILYEAASKSNALLVTERCNCRCIMCPQPPRNDEQDNVAISLEVISLIDTETKVLGITGGEPTLVWAGLMRILEACRDRLPKARIELLTNAKVLKDYSKAQALADAGSGALMACIPIYADTSQQHDKIVCASESFWDTLEGIYNLERVGLAVEIRTVIIKQNFNRLPAWAEFIYKNFTFASHIALMGIEPTGIARENLEEVWVDPIDYMPALEEAVKVLHRRNMNVSIYNHQLCILPEQLRKFSKKAISEWKNIFMQECENCKIRSQCGGFFHSSQEIRSRGIKPVLTRELTDPV